MSGNGLMMIVDGPFPTAAGGAESQVITLGNELAQLGHQPIHVLALQRDAEEKTARYGALGVHRIRVIGIRYLASLSFVCGAMVQLIARRREYEAIHIHKADYLAAAATLIAALLRKKILIKVTGFTDVNEGVLNPERSGLYGRLLRRIFRWADFQATSDAIARHLLQLGYSESRIWRIPNAVDLSRFRPTEAPAAARAERGIPELRTAVFVGRLVAVKGLDVLLNAWQRVYGDTPTQLLIAGNGELSDELSRQVQQRGLSESVWLLGAVDDVPDLLRCANFAVLPSHAEGLSNSLLEYMAAGLPVLGTRVSGTEDLVEPGSTGWLAEPGDAADLADQLEQIARLSDTELRAMGHNARRRIAEYAGFDAVVARLEQAYGFQPEWRRSCAG